MDRAANETQESETDMSSPRKLVVVVPAYNEGKGIGATIDGLHSIKDTLAGMGWTLAVYVVDDGSKDDTRQRAAAAERVLIHRVNQGLGAAVRTGLAAARADGADIAVKFDADLQHEPADIPALMEPILSDQADVVYGNRFERIDYRMPPMRRVGNFLFTRLMGWLTGWPLRDSQPGIFAVNRGYLEVFMLPGDYNYTQQVLLDAYHNGMRFAHVPVAFHKRTTGKSFVSLKYPFKVLPQIMMVIVGIRPMRVFVPIGTVLLVTAGAFFVYELAQHFRGINPKPIQHVNLVLGLSFFGLQTFFFGILAELIVRGQRK